MSRKINEVYLVLGKVSQSLREEEYQMLMDYISKMEDLLDESDSEDAFGSEGWKHHAGYED